MIYTPPTKVLEEYAKLLVDFALGSGEGVKPGEVVYLKAFLSALPLYNELQKALVNSGAIVITALEDDTSEFQKYYFKNATDAQISKRLDKYDKGLVGEIDHFIGILSEYDMHELDKSDPRKVMLKQKKAAKLRELMDAKENKGRFTWVLALYGTPSMAKEANLSQKVYWDEIIKACYLDKPSPIEEWKRITKEVLRVGQVLSAMKIQKVRIHGVDADLSVKIGTNRQWLGGSGRNIPSFEVFTSPDWRGTEGWIRFNQPVSRYGKIIEGVELHFKSGKITKALASKNQEMLDEILATDPGASRLGEFSLTDKRLSRITKFMAETLFDENTGGKYGNTHLAVGRSFYDTFTGDSANMDQKTADKLGLNHSAVHVDMVSTTDRTVTAQLQGGVEKVIYKNGQFTI